MTKKMLIDATHPEETRVVVADGNKVEDFDFESINKRQLAGNIYLAKVTRVEPSLQAAFVEYGGNRHGFLAFAEIHPDYYQIPMADREALLAEEERAAKAEAASEEAEAEAPAKKSRSRRRSKDKEKEPAEAKAEETPAKPARRRRTKKAAEAEEAEAPKTEPAAEAPAEAETAEAEAKPRRKRRSGSGRRQASAGSLDVIDLEAEGAAPEPGAVPKGLEIAAPEGDAPEGETGAPEAPEEAPAPAPEAEPAASATETAGAPDAGDPAPADEVLAGEADAAPAETLDAALGAVPEDASDPAGLPEAPAELAAPEAEPTPVPDSPVPGEDPAEAAPEEAGEDGPEEDDTPPSGPRSIAEASGLDEETVAEDIAPAEGDAEPEAKPKRSRGGAKRTRSRKPREEEPEEAAEAADESPIEEAGAEDPREELIRERTIRKRRYRIQDVIKVRQILLVQVVKEERGNKGAALTTYLSLAGRYCVLMPNTARGGGISRKITNAPDRKRLREVVSTLEVPKGMGLIVRTAGAERTKPEIKRDYEFLLRQWEQIRELTLKSIAPCLIYEEGSLIKRSIRDIYSKEIDEVLVEGEAGYREAKDYMKMLTPSHAKNVKQYSDTVPLFIRYQVESYLNGMFSPVVQLKSGGYIVIGITEALVAIDVNSGRSTKEGSVEDTALKTNLEAADEVARQLRLRDLAGLIVIDFIDMDEGRNNRAVEKRMKERLKTDRARIQIGRISGFGLMEMSRQRLRPGMLEASTKPCPSCHGTGTIRSDESLALAILREVEEQGVRDRFKEVMVTCPTDIANFLINAKRAHIARIEDRHGLKVSVFGDPGLVSPDYKLEKVKAPAREAQASTEVITAASALAPKPAEEPAEPAPSGERTAPAPAPEARGGDTDGDGKRRRRGKRGGRRRRGRNGEGQEGEIRQTGEAEAEAEAGAEDRDETAAADAPEAAAEREPDAAAASEPAAPETSGEAAPEPEAKPKRARGGRRGQSRRGAKAEDAPAAPAPEASADQEPEPPTAPAPEAAEGEAATPEPTAAEPQAAPAGSDDDPGAAEAAPEPEAAADGETGEAASSGGPAEADTETAPSEEAHEADGPAKPKRRGWWSFGF